MTKKVSLSEPGVEHAGSSALGKSENVMNSGLKSPFYQIK